MIILSLLAVFILGFMVGFFFTEPKYEEKSFETQVGSGIILGLMFTCFIAITIICSLAVFQFLK